MVKRVIKGWDCERVCLEFEEEGKDEWLLLDVRQLIWNQIFLVGRGWGQDIGRGSSQHKLPRGGERHSRPLMDYRLRLEMKFRFAINLQ